MTRQRSNGSKSAHDSYEFQYSSLNFYFFHFREIRDHSNSDVSRHHNHFFSFRIIQFLPWSSVSSVFFLVFFNWIHDYYNYAAFQSVDFYPQSSLTMMFSIFLLRINVSNHHQGVYLKFKVWKNLDFLFLEAAQCLWLFYLLTW